MVSVDKAFEIRYKLGNEQFEVLVDFDKLKEFKKKPDEISVYDILADSRIYKDQKKGELASENVLEKIFSGKDEEQILKEILLKGECQIPTAYLNSLREEKREQIINYISSNSVNPATRTKYTFSMIESEFKKINFNVNPETDIVKQAEEVLKLMKKSIPISIDKTTLEISVPPQYCGNFYGPFRKYGKVTKEFYDNEGNLRLHIEVTSGILDDVINFIKMKSNNEASYHTSQE